MESVNMTADKQVLREMLLAMPEKKRRELTHCLLEHHIYAASGCWTLVDILCQAASVNVLVNDVVPNFK